MALRSARLGTPPGTRTTAGGTGLGDAPPSSTIEMFAFISQSESSKV